MNNMQALVDGLSAGWMRERAESQMTLGKLIDRLKELPPETEVANLIEPHSYRGYYSDLAFMEGEGKRTADSLLGECQEAMGEVFIGYKGGDYVMGRNTPVWIASYSGLGKKIISLRDDGTLELTDDE